MNWLGVTSRESVRTGLLFTIAAVGIYELGLQAPLPGVDRGRLLESLALFPTLSDYDALLRGGLSKAAVFSLGVTPYIAASIVVLLCSGAVRRLRRLRDGGAEGAATFDRIIYGTTIAFALIQGWGLATLLEIISMRSGQAVVSDPGVVFKVQTAVILMTGAIFLVWMADQITRRGLVNGVVLIVLVDLLAEVVSGFKVEVSALSHGVLMPRPAVLFLIGTGGLFALSLFMVRAERRIPLTYAQDRPHDRPGTTWKPSIVLRMNTVGTLPIAIAGIVMLPLHYAGVTPGSAIGWILYCGAIIFFTYMWTAATFSPGDVLAQVQRYGFVLADPDPGKAPQDYVDRIVERLVTRHAAFLLVLALVGPLVVARLGIGSRFGWLAGPPLLVIAAIGVAIVERVRVLRQQHDGQPPADWVPVFEADTELEVDLARGNLERAGIPTVRSSQRAIPITGTLAFWEASRPPTPSLTIYRGLGGGRVYAEVPREHVQQAVSLLASTRTGTATATTPTRPA